jgi:hypothetical protein
VNIDPHAGPDSRDGGMNIVTVEQVEKHHLAVLGSDIGPLYHALHNEVIWLHAKWKEFRKLYGTSEERVNLLNQTAGFFFGVVEDVLWNDVLLHITRLTDPSKQGEYQNLTLFRLPSVLANGELKSEISRLLNQARTDSEFARDWRNRRIAHLELGTALKGEATMRASRENVEKVLSIFRDILNAFRRKFFHDEFAFEDVVVTGDADSLLHRVKFALQSEQQRMDRHRSGRAIPEDNLPFPKL